GVGFRSRSLWAPFAPATPRDAGLVAPLHSGTTLPSTDLWATRSTRAQPRAKPPSEQRMSAPETSASLAGNGRGQADRPLPAGRTTLVPTPLKHARRAAGRWSPA